MGSTLEMVGGCDFLICAGNHVFRMGNGKKDVLFYVFKKDMKRLINGSCMP